MPHRRPSTARAAIAALTDLGKGGKLLGYRQLFHSFNQQPNSPPDSAEALYISGEFRRFQARGIDPDEFTISKIFTAASDLGALSEGAQFHAFALKKNLYMDVAAMNSLITFYCKCGSADDADKVFDRMPVRDIFSWTIMVSGYALRGRVSAAMDLFQRMPRRNTVSWNSIISGCQREGFDTMAVDLFFKMREEGKNPNNLTFIAVIKAHISLQLLDAGRAVHCCAIKTAWMIDVLLGSTLVDMYAKFGFMLDAEKVFSEISEQTVVSWSILLAGFAQNGMIVEAEKVFAEMPERNVALWNGLIVGLVQNGMLCRAVVVLVDMIRNGFRPDSRTLTSLLSGCSSLRCSNEGKMFHCYAVKVNLMLDVSVCNSMMSMYGKQGNSSDARLIFDVMETYDVISWTAMMAAYVTNNDVKEARKIFNRMPLKNLISWNTMMFGYLQNCKNVEVNSLNDGRNLSFCIDDVLGFFNEMMRSEIRPDHFTYNCALTTCGCVGTLCQATAIHCGALKRGFESDIGVGNALINVYGKCGSLGDAVRVFKSSNTPDIISWNALLTAYSQNGQESKALNFFDEMRRSGIELNHVTFISLLTACSHTGDVEKGREYFNMMERDYSIVPTKEHYACIVDLLGRAGLLGEAEGVIERMPIEPDAAVWGALLGACKIHGDQLMGEKAAEQIFMLDPNDVSAHIAVAETFAAKDMWRDVENLRELMRKKGISKEPGCSWIDVKKS